MNSIGFFGLHLMTAGCCFPKEEGGEIYEEHIPGGIKRLFTKDGFLTGFMLIGATDRAGHLYRHDSGTNPAGYR